jgi:hypothetical protein
MSASDRSRARWQATTWPGELLLPGRLAAAAFGGVAAAGAEVATGRRMGRVGDVALQHEAAGAQAGSGTGTAESKASV